jgi:7-keto-8-aminopelargonate synthetase-like enzyme
MQSGYDADALLYESPSRFEELRQIYFGFLGSRVANAAHAIECAEAGERPHAFAIGLPGFEAAFLRALREVRTERTRRDRDRRNLDQFAAALLAASRLRDELESE